MDLIRTQYKQTLSLKKGLLRMLPQDNAGRAGYSNSRPCLGFGTKRNVSLLLSTSQNGRPGSLEDPQHDETKVRQIRCWRKEAAQYSHRASSRGFDKAEL